VATRDSLSESSDSPSSDPLARLRQVRVALAEHSDGKCPKCSAFSLTEEDAFDEERDAVARTWRCSKCEYSRHVFGIPIALWKSSDQDRWYKKAAARRAKGALIRCPTCGNESLKATESGVTGFGTSAHVILACKTKGCEFEERSTERSITGTARSGLRYGILLAAVLAAAAVAAKVKGAFESAAAPATVASVSPVGPGMDAPRDSSGAPSAASVLAAPSAIVSATTPGTNDPAATMGGSPETSPLVMAWSGRVRGSTSGPLEAGMKLHSGDGIALSVTTSAPASVYLLFCNGAGAMSVYPPSGPLQTSAMNPLAIPGQDQELTVDQHPGRDVLYVLASRWPLTQADPALAKRLTAKAGSAESECGTPLDQQVAGVPPGSSSSASASKSTARGFDITPVNPSGPAPVRSVRSGPDGIAALRIQIEHLPR
jgi:hypothetical protein